MHRGTVCAKILYTKSHRIAFCERVYGEWQCRPKGDVLEYMGQNTGSRPLKRSIRVILGVQGFKQQDSSFLDDNITSIDSKAKKNIKNWKIRNRKKGISRTTQIIKNKMSPNSFAYVAINYMSKYSYPRQRKVQIWPRFYIKTKYAMLFVLMLPITCRSIKWKNVQRCI